jgi:hypothetical protein
MLNVSNKHPKRISLKRNYQKQYQENMTQDYQDASSEVARLMEKAKTEAHELYYQSSDSLSYPLATPSNSATEEENKDRQIEVIASSIFIHQMQKEWRKKWESKLTESQLNEILCNARF